MVINCGETSQVYINRKLSDFDEKVWGTMRMRCFESTLIGPHFSIRWEMCWRWNTNFKLLRNQFENCGWLALSIMLLLVMEYLFWSHLFYHMKFRRIFVIVWLMLCIAVKFSSFLSNVFQLMLCILMDNSVEYPS